MIVFIYYVDISYIGNLLLTLVISKKIYSSAKMYFSGKSVIYLSTITTIPMIVIIEGTYLMTIGNF
jgi:hypothetical protein